MKGNLVLAVKNNSDKRDRAHTNKAGVEMAQVAPDVKLGEVFNPVDQNPTGLNKDALSSLDLSHPPPGFFRVEVFFYVNSVSRVNLAAMNAQVDVGVCLNWKDPRMVGFPFTDTVPSNLWGPMVNLWNCEGDASIEHKDFYVADSATGSLSRTTRYVATVSFEMHETFDLFPFDMIDIPMKMTNANVGILADNVTKTFTNFDSLQFIIHPSKKAEAPLYQFWTFGEHLTEWKMEGCSLICDDDDAKKKVEHLTLNFHYSRRPGYYLWKMILPLFILTVVSLAVFVFPVDDIVDRFNYLLTVLLSSFALLFVIGADVPRTGSLMSIDRNILLSLSATLAACVISLIAFFLHSQSINNIGGGSIFCGTLVFFIIFLLQPYYASRKAIAKISNFQNFQSLRTILGSKDTL